MVPFRYPLQISRSFSLTKIQLVTARKKNIEDVLPCIFGKDVHQVNSVEELFQELDTLNLHYAGQFKLTKKIKKRNKDLAKLKAVIEILVQGNKTDRFAF